MKGNDLPPPNKNSGTQRLTRAVDGVANVLQFGQKGALFSEVTHYVRDTYVEGAMVAWNGEKIKNKVLKTNVIKGTLDPVWCTEDNDEDAGYVFKFDAESGAATAEFVRLDVIDCRNAANDALAEKLGVVYVPVVDFSVSEIEKTYHITSHKQVPAYLKHSSLGTLTVKIKRLVCIQENLTKHLSVRSTLHSSAIYDSMWYTQAIPSGCVHKPQEECSALDEHLLLCASYSGIVLKDLAFDDMKQNSDIRNFIEWNKSKESSFCIMFVYENQRRTLIPLTEFSCDRLADSDRPALSDETGIKRFPFYSIQDTAPPEGYEFDGDWSIDTKYTSTDADGFSYGINFEYIMSNYRRSKSNSSHTSGRSVRRRRWIRTLKKVDVDPSPKTTKKFVASFDRAEEYMKTPDQLLRLSEEKNDLTGDILIPYDQVVNYEVVTPSVLSIRIKIHRYFGATSDEKGGVSTEACFREAEMDLFVVHCPARELMWVLDERKDLSGTREAVKMLIEDGVLNAADENEDFESEEDSTPDLSIGSLIKGLDSYAFSLEKNYDNTVVKLRLQEDSSSPNARSDAARNTYEADDRMNPFSSTSAVHEWSTSYNFRTLITTPVICGRKDQIESRLYLNARKSSRLRVYIGTLLGFGLEGGHNFEIEEVERILQKDIATAQTIGVDNPAFGEDNVEAFARINFLLYTAENRIRDTILTGWSKLHGDDGDPDNYDGPLSKCLHIFINGYYIEIVALLAKFFEGRGLEGMKGVERKKALISFFLKNNSSLSDMLTSALRPFRLTVQPEPVLTHLLDIDNLVGFYNTILLTEMSTLAGNALMQCKNNSKEESGIDYCYILPWYPLKNSTGEYETRIPEGVSSVVVTYLKSSLVRSNEEAGFQELVKRLETKVLASVAATYNLLATKIMHNVGNIDWTKPLKVLDGEVVNAFEQFDTTTEVGDSIPDDEQNELLQELDEHVPFLCSVSNDCQRIIDRRLIENHMKDLTEYGRGRSNADTSTREAIKNAYMKFEVVGRFAIESLSCVLFNEVSRTILDLKAFATKWISGEVKMVATTPREAQNASCVVNALMNIFEDCYNGLLYKKNASTLLYVIAKKIVLIYMYIVREAPSRSFTPLVCERFAEEIKSIKALFSQHALGPSDAEIEEYMMILEDVFDLISADLKSEKFNVCLQKICDLGNYNKIDARAYGSLLLHCMALRHDKGQFQADDSEIKNTGDDIEDDEDVAMPSYTEPIILSLEDVYSSQPKETISAQVVKLESRSSIWLIFQEKVKGEEDVILDLYGLSIQTLLLRSAFPLPKLRTYCSTKTNNKMRRPLALLHNMRHMFKKRESAHSSVASFFEHDQDEELTHRIEIVGFRGYNFPVAYTSGKPTCYLVASLSGVAKKEKTSTISGDYPTWNDKLLFEVPCGYLHRKLRLKLLYKPKLFGDDAEIGSVSYPLVSVDESGQEEDKSNISTIKVTFNPNEKIKGLKEACEQIQEEGREPMALEFSMKVHRIL